MKSLSILGSTGSIGTQALEVKGEYNIKAISCHGNIELLKEQIAQHNPEFVAVFDEEKADQLQSQVNVEVMSGMNGLLKVSKESDVVLNALVGSIGILPTIEALKAKKTVALANKETLVSAGSIVMKEVEKNNTTLLPVDSEHSAIFQCLNGEDQKNVKKILLTCSGGPFRKKSLEELKKVTKADALKHPNWDMGAKITIDSSTLMNKGLEVIEAHHLFNIKYDDIEVVVHPQSIIHSLVEFKDTSIMAQLGLPSMKVPIQYALSYPDRFDLNTKSLNLAEIGSLSFEKPDVERFPCLKLAFDAGKVGGTMPCVLNAANEVAVKKFLEEEIEYQDIPKLVQKHIENHNIIKSPELDDILKIDKEIKEEK